MYIYGRIFYCSVKKYNIDMVVVFTICMSTGLPIPLIHPNLYNNS